MGSHSLDKLMRLYTLETITVEQMMGQVLQHLQRIEAAFNNMAKLRRDAQRNA